MDTDKAIAWIEGRWPAGCPMCGRSDWTVSTDMGLLIGSMDAHKNVDLTRGMPIVPVSCNHCSYVALLDAIKAGLEGR